MMDETKQIIDDYLIDFEKILGQGSQGQIFQCQKISTQEQIVAKLTKFNYQIPNTFEREIAIVNSIKTQKYIQNLIKVYDIIVVEKDGLKELYEFMEKCDSDLGKLIEVYKSNKKSFTFQEVVDFTGQIIRGYCALNSLNIIHRDLKPENILISKIGDKIELKITDFGVGKVLTNDYAITKTGTPKYQAPELTCSTSTQVYTNKSDIFSLGVILYELVYNQILFSKGGRQMQQDKCSLKTKPIKCPQIEGFESQFLEVIDNMLIFSPDERISWDQLENHFYFKNYFPQKNIPTKNFKQFYEYIFVIYQQTCKIISIFEKFPQNFDWKIVLIILIKYVLINFQNELIQIVEAIKIDEQKNNKSISTVFYKKVEQNEILQAQEKYDAKMNQFNNNQILEKLKEEINQFKLKDNLEDSFFEEFYDSILKQPEDQSLFDFWHIKFQVIYKTYIRQWLINYFIDKTLTLKDVYLLEKFSNLLEEYPKTSYYNFESNQIHSKIIKKDYIIDYLKQKQLI